MLPVFQFYFNETYNLDFTQMGSLESLAAIIFFIFTIPCGAFSDLISRKTSVLIGSLLTALSMLIVGLGKKYGIFMFGYGIWAVGDSFLYNARGAMMYDTVKQIGREEEYIRISGRANIITVFPLIFSGFLGPYLFSLNPDLPWYFPSGLWFISVIIVAFMVEPEKKKQDYTFKNYIQKIGDGVKFIIQEKHVLWMMFLMIAMSVPLSIFNEVISQNFFKHIGFGDIFQLGIEKVDYMWIFPVIYGLASLTASQSHRLEKLFGENGSFFFIIAMHSVGLLLMGLLGFIQTPYALIVVMFTYISRDFRWVFGDSYLNKHSESEIRTTIMSIITMAISLVMTFSYTLGGYMGDKLKIPLTLVILGIFTTVCSVILVVTKPMNNNKNGKNKLLETVNLPRSQ